MAVSDYRAGKVVTTVPIGAGTDGAGFDAATGNASASNADGSLTVIHQDSPDAYHIAQTVTTPTASRNLGLDPTTHPRFLAAAKFAPLPAGATGRQRPSMIPDSSVILVVEKTNQIK